MFAAALPSRKNPLIWGGVLALIIAAIYLPILSNGFVYDSESQVLNDSFIHDLRNLPDVLTLRVLSRDVLDFNRPVNLASLMMDSIIWAKNPFGYHLTNLLLHVCVCLLLFTALSRWGNVPVAFGAALLFGLHPVNVEAVAEVAFREDLLVVFFALGGLLLVDYLEGSRWGIVAGVVCFFMAAASKETGMITPIWLGAWWLLGLGGRGSEGIAEVESGKSNVESKSKLGQTGRKKRRNWTGIAPHFRVPTFDFGLAGAASPSAKAYANPCYWWILLGGSAVVVGAFTACRFILAPQHSAIFTEAASRLGGSLIDTLLIQTRIWAAYFCQILFPVNLCADYGAYSLRNFSLATSLVVLLVMGAAQMYLSCQSRLFAFGAMTFWFFLLPASNFIPMFRPMADRFLYFPMIGAAIMLASLLTRFRKRGPAALCLAGFLVVAVALGSQTFAREQVWHDNISLWKATLETNPLSRTAFDNLTGALVQAGRPEEALKYFENGIPISRVPDAEAYAVRALALEAVGRHEEADAAFKTAVRLDSRYGTPDRLVQALTWNRHDADKLQLIANRN